MPLSPHNIPLSVSLRSRVLRDFAPAAEPPAGTQMLNRDEVASFLAKSKDTDGSPLTTIRRRAARENRDPVLAPDDEATLVWIYDAFADWEDNYALEGPLRDQAHRLLPLCIAVALYDDSFFTPGVHPLHQLLDEIQQGSVGWQVRLDRAGQMLEQRIERSIDKALEWFTNRRVDLGTIVRELAAANERDAARAQRMVQRLAETEGARLKTLTARREAALQINAGLKEFNLPAAIGEFLKGPWFDSAQMVLVKHGSDSPAWADMQRTARQLMESVQRPADESGGQVQNQEQLLRVMPEELRRWLLSIEHDSDATDSAIGLVEYVHLRLRHGQRLELVEVPPLELDSQSMPEPAAGHREALEDAGWYLFQESDGPLRAQLVLQLEDSEHLLFANCVGLKALDLSYSAFEQRLRDGLATPLPNTHSFSLSLASAAGIDSDAKLANGIDLPPQVERPPESPAREDGPSRASLLTELRSQRAAIAAAEEEDSNVAPQAPGTGAVPESPEFDGETELARDGISELSLDLDPDEEDEIEAPGTPQDPSAREHGAPTAAPVAAARRIEQEPPSDTAVESTRALPSQAEPVEPAPGIDEPDPLADVPMGSWLGFHDGDTPIMAKLAVFDPRRGYYIFVNRKGIAMREISRAELISLIDRGLVDILETRSYFRDEVERAREKKP